MVRIKIQKKRKKVQIFFTVNCTLTILLILSKISNKILNVTFAGTFVQKENYPVNSGN
jgi:hypothetical protein